MTVAKLIALEWITDNEATYTPLFALLDIPCDNAGVQSVQRQSVHQRIIPAYDRPIISSLRHTHHILK